MTNHESIFDQLKKQIPVDEEEPLILNRDSSVGLVIVDVVNGFCTIGSGNMVWFNFSKKKLWLCLFLFLNAFQVFVILLKSKRIDIISRKKCDFVLFVFFVS